MEAPRRPRRARRSFASRIEPLESRALLNASIDVDAGGRVTYESDPAIASALRVSQDGGVYTFDLGAAGPGIDVTGNAAGLAVTGSGTRKVTVAGPSAIQLVALADSDSILLASSAVPVGIALQASHVAATVGDRSDPLGLAAVTGPVSVAGSGVSSGDSLVVDDRGWREPFSDLPYGTRYLTLTSDSVSPRPGAAAVGYSGISALTIYGGATSGNGTAPSEIAGTADGVATTIDLSAGSHSQSITVSSTSADASSRLTILGSRGSNGVNIYSAAAPVTYQAAPSSGLSYLSVYVAGMTAGAAIDVESAGAAATLSIYVDGLPVAGSNFLAAPSGKVVFTAPAPRGGTVAFDASTHASVYGLQLPPLDVESNTLTSTGAPLTDVVVATFTLDAPPQIPANFSVQVLWGDDSPADNNHVVADPSDPTRYEIRGTHTYAQPGTYTPGVIMSAFYGYGSNATIDVGGAAIDLYYRYTVVFSRNALVIQGGAGAAYSAPGTANTPTPPVFGLASAAGARVEVYATPAGGEPFRIGSGTVNGGGSWFIIPDVPLADGRYAITAQAFDDATGRASALTTLNDSLVIDTVAPRVVDVRFVPMRGEVVVTFRDYGGADDVGTGLDFASLTRPYSYSFSRLANPVRGYRGPSRWTVTAVDGEEARVGEPQQVAVRINRGRPIRGGTYLFTARSSFEIRDRAGNALQGGFDGTFPTQGPGDFVAQLSSLHRQVFPPQPAGAAPLSARVPARAKLAHARPRHG